MSATEGSPLTIVGYVLGLSNIKNSELQLLQQRHCDYCHNIALEYFTVKNKAKHHHTCIPLETAKL